MGEFWIILLFSYVISSQGRDIFVSDEVPIYEVEAPEKNEVNEDLKGEIEHAPCHMEYQVMKRVVGTCIKLGKSATGCVAGNYLHPFHPECI